MDGETIIQIRLRPHALSFFFFGGIITMLDAAAATDVRGSARSDTRRKIYREIKFDAMNIKINSESDN